MFEQFKNPASNYRLMPFWIWNSIPDPAEIERRIHEMSGRGFGGFIVCPSSDIIEDGSTQWSRCVKLAGELAGSLGMAAEFGDPAACSSTAGGNTLGDRILRAKMASSAVHVAGGTRTAVRLFGGEGWDLTHQRMKAAVDLECALGANFFCPEAMYYTLAAVSDHCSAPPLSYQSTLWSQFGAFAEYAARLSYALSQGKHRAQVALLLPGKTFAEEKSVRDMQLIRDFARDSFAAYCEWLPRLHIDYDLLAEDSLTEATAVDQNLLIGGERYELLILPPLTSIGYRAAGMIREFVEDGGRVLGTTLLPVDDALLSEHELVRRTFAEIFDVNPLELRANLLEGLAPRSPRLSTAASGALLLEVEKPPDLIGGLRSAVSNAIKLDISVRRKSVECPDILVCARTSDDLDLVFLCNQAPQAREVQISIRSVRAPLLLHPETGQVSALPDCTQQGSRTILMHRFEPFGSLLIGFLDEPTLAVPAPAMDAGIETPLLDDWEFELLGPNTLPLLEWESDATAAGFHATFHAEHVPGDLALLFEHSSETGDERGLPSVLVNGKEARPPERLEDPSFRIFRISDLTAIGGNTLTLSGVAGDGARDQIALARPRLIGSFALEPDRETLCEPISRLGTGSWTTQGYPFYSGSAAYRQTVEIPPFLVSERIIVQTDEPGDTVEFVVNGAQAGTRLWAPFSIDITPLVKPGPNVIELRITNTLVNGVLGQGRPSGLLNGARLIVC